MPEGHGNIGFGLLVGIGVTLAGILALTLLGALTAGIGFILLLGIGLLQAAWIVPAFLHFKRRGQIETGKGILIVAGLVALLNATCWGALIGGKFKF